MYYPHFVCIAWGDVQNGHKPKWPPPKWPDTGESSMVVTTLANMHNGNIKH